MTPHDLAEEVVVALRRMGVSASEDDVELRPRPDRVGWWVTPVALRVAGRTAGTTPRELADTLSATLAALDGVEGTEVAGPGLLHVLLPLPLDSSAIHEVLRAEPGRTNRGVGRLAPPSRWVAATTAPRTLRDPENPLLLVQLGRARLARRLAKDPHDPGRPDARRAWQVVVLAWDAPRLTRRAKTGDTEPLARLLEDAARIGLEAEDLPSDDAAAVFDILDSGLRLLGTARPDHV